MSRIKNNSNDKEEGLPDDRRSNIRRVLKAFTCLLTLFFAILFFKIDEPDKVYSFNEAAETSASDNPAPGSFYKTGDLLFSVNKSYVILFPDEVQVTVSAYIEPDIYNPEIPLSEELQQYLYDLCLQRELDYKTVLAVIAHESNFHPDALGGGSNYGLFQINTCNHKKLCAALNTENTPFDPKTNINWGTYMLSCLYDKYSKYYQGDELTRAVLSAYNKGEGGFEKYGFALGYLDDHEKALARINSWFEG